MLPELTLSTINIIIDRMCGLREFASAAVHKYGCFIASHTRLCVIPAPALIIIFDLINTLGKPIVCTPRDAIECFWSSPFDALVLGSFLLEK